MNEAQSDNDKTEAPPKMVVKAKDYNDDGKV